VPEVVTVMRSSPFRVPRPCTALLVGSATILCACGGENEESQNRYVAAMMPTMSVAKLMVNQKVSRFSIISLARGP
jgi:hypothetical protein